MKHSLQHIINSLPAMLPSTSSWLFQEQLKETKTNIQTVLKLLNCEAPLMPIRLYKEYLPMSIIEMNWFSKEIAQYLKKIIEHIESNHKEIIMNRFFDIKENFLLTQNCQLSEKEIMQYHLDHYSKKRTFSEDEINNMLMYEVLDQIDISWNIFKQQEESTLIEAFHNFKKLKYIRCSFSWVVLSDLPKLANIIASVSNLTTLDFGEWFDQKKDTFEMLKTILSKIPHLQILDIDSTILDICSKEEIKEVFSFLPHLNTFNLWRSNFRIDTEKFLVVGESIRHIYSLNLRNTQLGNYDKKTLQMFFYGLKNLKDFAINCHPLISCSPDILSCIFSHLENLKSLDLFWLNLHNYEKKHISAIFQNLKKLRYLSMEWLDFGENEESIITMFWYLTQLESIDLSHNIFNNPSVEYIQAIFSHLKNIRHITCGMGHICSFEWEHWETFLSCFPRLESLDISLWYTDNWKEAHWKAIQKIPHLKYLNISSTPIVDDANELQKIASCLSKLDYLVLGNTFLDYHTWDNLRIFLLPLQNLKAIYISEENYTHFCHIVPEMTDVFEKIV